VLLLSPAEGALLRSPPQFSLWYPRYEPSANWQSRHGYVSTISLRCQGFLCGALGCYNRAEVILEAWKRRERYGTMPLLYPREKR
jgi:hypothetical protein